MKFYLASCTCVASTVAWHPSFHCTSCHERLLETYVEKSSWWNPPKWRLWILIRYRYLTARVSLPDLSCDGGCIWYLTRGLSAATNQALSSVFVILRMRPKAPCIIPHFRCFSYERDIKFLTRTLIEYFCNYLCLLEREQNHFIFFHIDHLFLSTSICFPCFYSTTKLHAIACPKY